MAEMRETGCLSEQRSVSVALTSGTGSGRQVRATEGGASVRPALGFPFVLPGLPRSDCCAITQGPEARDLPVELEKSLLFMCRPLLYKDRGDLNIT